MKFLIDNQLPPSLTRFLCDRGLECQHVSDLQLDKASDREIWSYAEAHQCVVISKDEDFLHLAKQKESTACLIWIRLGNCRKQTLLKAFETTLPQIENKLKAGEQIIEIR